MADREKEMAQTDRVPLVYQRVGNTCNTLQSKYFIDEAYAILRSPIKYDVNSFHFQHIYTHADARALVLSIVCFCASPSVSQISLLLVHSEDHSHICYVTSTKHHDRAI